MTLPKLIKLVLPHTVVATLLLAPFAIQAADTASGELNTSSPTYDRIFTASVDPNCNATSSFSGTVVGVYYQVFPFYSTSGEAADVEITNSTVGDTTISIYCDFDPTDASLSLVAYDDDGGVGLLSAITPAEAAILLPTPPTISWCRPLAPVILVPLMSYFVAISCLATLVRHQYP